MQAVICIAGVDVAKAELVISTDPDSNAVRSIANNEQAIAAWLQTLAASSVVAMESSGIYHQLLAQLAHAAGMQVYVLNAQDVHMYAKAVSARAKTDRLDAAVIARYVREHRQHLKPWQSSAPTALLVQQVLDRRSKLTAQLVMVRQSLKAIPQLQDAAQQLEQAYQDVMRQMDALLQELVAQELPLQSATQRLQSITGFGPQAAMRLAALFSRIEFANANAVVAYSGLDPRANDSGTKHGRRRLSKRGPAALRRQMYLAGFAACHSHAFKDVYAALRLRMSSTQALVVLARKLLRIAWAVWKTGKAFEISQLKGLPACQKT